MNPYLQQSLSHAADCLRARGLDQQHAQDVANGQVGKPSPYSTDGPFGGVFKDPLCMTLPQFSPLGPIIPISMPVPDTGEPGVLVPTGSPGLPAIVPVPTLGDFVTGGAQDSSGENPVGALPEAEVGAESRRRVGTNGRRSVRRRSKHASIG